MDYKQITFSEAASFRCFTRTKQATRVFWSPACWESLMIKEDATHPLKVLMGLGGGWRWAPVGSKVDSPDLWLYFLQLRHGFHHPDAARSSRSSRVTCHGCGLSTGLWEEPWWDVLSGRRPAADCQRIPTAATLGGGRFQESTGPSTGKGCTSPGEKCIKTSERASIVSHLRYSRQLNNTNILF